MNLRATTLKPQNDRPGHTQMKSILVVPPIGCSQVWIGLSEPQQQQVAATVIQICQALIHHCPQPIEHSGGNYE
jgi:hypothetical protein